MTQWEYYLTGDLSDAGDGGRTGLIRAPAGGPVSLAEFVLPSGGWMISATLWKNRYEGADEPVRPIGVEAAETMLRRWVGTGRLAAYPSDESSVPSEEAERLSAAERGARDVWSRVEMPPGADQITF